MPRRKRATPNKRLIRQWQREIDEMNRRIDRGYEPTDAEWTRYNGLKQNIQLEQRRGARYIGDLGVPGVQW